jgi:hypothetical protein
VRRKKLKFSDWLLVAVVESTRRQPNVCGECIELATQMTKINGQRSMAKNDYFKKQETFSSLVANGNLASSR